MFAQMIRSNGRSNPQRKAVIGPSAPVYASAQADNFAARIMRGTITEVQRASRAVVQAIARAAWISPQGQDQSR